MAASEKIVLITGSDELRVKDEAFAWASQHRPSDDEMGLEIVDGWVATGVEAVAALRQAAMALQSPGLFCSDRLIWFKNVTALGSDDEFTTKAVDAAWTDFLAVAGAGLSEGTQLLVSAPCPDKRRSPFKKLKDLAKTFDFEALSTRTRDWEEEAARMVEAQFRQSGIKVTPSVVEAVVRLCGADARTLRQEVEKVCLHVREQGHATEEDVELMVATSREETVWSWCDAVVEGKTSRALALLRQLEHQRENAVGLMVNLTSHLRLAMQCRVLLDNKLLRISSPFAAQAVGEGERLLAGRDGKAPAAFRLARVGNQAKLKDAKHWAAALEQGFQAYAHLFETGADHFRKLESLIFALSSVQTPATGTRP
jgi:DNA polymerase III delta subunit